MFAYQRQGDRDDSFGGTCITLSTYAIHNLADCSQSRMLTKSPSTTKCQPCHCLDTHTAMPALFYLPTFPFFPQTDVVPDSLGPQ